MQPNDSCICGSKKAFGKCCEPFLSFKAKPRTIRQLVRSRYAAYALGGHQEYLLKTWHPATARSVSLAHLDAPGHEWKGLEIIDAIQKGDLGRVEFKATYSEHGGPDRIHHEKSVFHRLDGTWLYLEGEVAEEE